MEIDLVKLITNNVDTININVDVYYDGEVLNKTNIRELKDTSFVGKIKKLYDDEYELGGVLSGKMILPDDITLEDVEYNFKVDILETFSENEGDIEKNIKIINNKLDISDFLWQNIVLEVPLKVVSEKNKDLTIEGDGWRFITEDALEQERSNNSPFDVLDDKFDLREGEDRDGSSSKKS
ncbi:MAG: DUF177 domain-containing protein [Bacilli bacterium]|nr:DUF177 domain-containing protein [Bacilli bacterium]